MAVTLELKAIDHRDPSGSGSRNWWGVRCPRCRAWLTRYDFTAEDALSLARGALASGSHVCGSKAGA